MNKDNVFYNQFLDNVVSKESMTSVECFSLWESAILSEDLTYKVIKSLSPSAKTYMQNTFTLIIFSIYNIDTDQIQSYETSN